MSEINITLYEATPADIETYIAIEKKVSGKTYSPLIKREDVLEEMNAGKVYMIQTKDGIVGSISYQTKEDKSIYLSGLAIDPKYQGMGLGRKALEQVFAQIKSVPRVWLVTHPDNVKAISLYQSLGFEITERKENYFGDGEPRIVLSRSSWK